MENIRMYMKEENKSYDRTDQWINNGRAVPYTNVNK